MQVRWYLLYMAVGVPFCIKDELLTPGFFLQSPPKQAIDYAIFPMVAGKRNAQFPYQHTQC